MLKLSEKQKNSKIQEPFLQESNIMSRERILNQQIQRPPYKNTPPHKNLFSCFQKQEQNEEDLEYLEKRSILSQVVDEKLTSNYIKTHKYTWINFIPLNLCDQFSKLANIYFLFIGILQMIPSITISEGKPVMYMPLTIVLVVSALKDLFEDLKKYKQDQEENQRQVTIIDETKDEKQVKWQHLRVGNIVKISQNEQIPADLVVLSTSDKKGLCYLETQNLDGETNLKRKEVPRELINPQTENNLRIQRFIHCEFGLPDPYIYHFNGSLSIDFGNDNQKIIKVPIDDKNFLLRGCTLKNTEQIYGLVVYTGQDTKIMRNSIKQRPKHSSVEKFMNICITVIFTIQMIVTFTSSAYASYWVLENRDDIQYLGNQETNVFIYWGTWVLIYTNFVPISLIVSLEMVKFIQAIFIGQDKHMYCYKNNIKADAQCSNVNEELGQIEYVFSDKTGTLTQNLMNFTNLIVNGRHYGEVHTISQQEIEKKYGRISNVKFFDGEFIENTRKIKGDQESKENLEALLLLSICNTVQAEEKDGKLIYNAESPDELSLINFAKLCGVEFEGTDENNIIKVKFGEKQMDKYQLLHKIEFNSARKRMSVIIKDLQTDKVILYCKGADNIILERTVQEQLKSREIKKTQQTLNQYSTIGLRTLLLAKKEMTLKEFQDWYQQFNTAKIERASQMEIHQLEEQIEENLTIIGATAIEDELRDDVGSTIKAIKDVGINFWVLTGDKLETAINIGISCQVLTKDQKRFILQNPNHPHQQTIQEQLEHIAKEIEYNKVNNIQKLNQQQKSQQYALIVPGDALIHISKSHEITQKFVKITENCASVIACRVSPIQKQEIVKMVRQTFPQKSTLAIGDGANDVNMITAAHVGIGIKGVEGLQAARASDYSIGEFKFLRNLLLYHGRECYRKNTNLILYNFYKNTLLILPQQFYGIFNGFSGSSLYDAWLYQCYNVMYTCFPIIIYAIFDKQYSVDFLIHQPYLYLPGKLHKYFNRKIFLIWLFVAAYQSFFIGICTFLMVERNPINQDGKMLFFASTGMISYWISVLQSNLKVLQISYSQSIASIIIIILTLLSYYGTYGFFSAYFATTDVYNTLSHQLQSPIYYLTVFVVICLTFGTDYLFYQVSERKKKVKIAYNLKQRENTGINNNSVNSLTNEQEIEMTEKI